MRLYFAALDDYRKADNLPGLERLRAYAALNRLNALSMIQRAGAGHIGASFSSMDIITYMHLEHPEIAFFSSRGHDAPAFYASLIAIGKLPYDMLHKLRRVGGLPGHPELKTPGIVAHAGSLGMGISKAKGLIRANRLRGIDQQVAVLVGDGELQEGQIWESLVDLDMEELTIIIDANGLSTERQIDLQLLTDRLDAFAFVMVIDGHDHATLAAAIARPYSSSRIIVAITTKARAISFAENQPRYHSGILTPEEYASASNELQATIRGYLPSFLPAIDDIPTPESSPNELIERYGEILDKAGAKNRQIVVLAADLAQDCGLTSFRAHQPQRFIECGIAEQDMVSQAGMLAANGFIPIVHSFAAFLTRRANEQIYDNCHQNLKVIYVGTLAGRLPDGPGPSHEALQDVMLMRTMPHIEILEPRTVDDVSLAVYYAINQAEGPVYIRLVANPIERVRVP